MMFIDGSDMVFPLLWAHIYKDFATVTKGMQRLYCEISYERTERTTVRFS